MQQKRLQQKRRHPWPHLPQRLRLLKLQLKLLQMRPLTHRQKLMQYHPMQCQLTQHQTNLPRPPSLHVLWWPCAVMTVPVKRNRCLHPQVDPAIAATAKRDRGATSQVWVTKRVAVLTEVIAVPIVVTALSAQTAARV